MQVFVGTSGYAYKEWKGGFYPPDLRPDEMLRFYGTHFSTVEINNTFYRMPKESVLRGWAAQVPDGFRFVLKASQRITHQHRLKNVDEPLGYLLNTAAVLGDKLGPMLFQLPPNFKKDTDRLRAFLELVDEPYRAALEFRHDSWFTDDVYRTLQDHNAALCVAETDERPAELVATADWGYLRLRREDYDDARLRAWSERVQAQPWREAFVFFKHEDEPTAPAWARQFLRIQ